MYGIGNRKDRIQLYFSLSASPYHIPSNMPSSQLHVFKKKKEISLSSIGVAHMSLHIALPTSSSTHSVVNW